MEQGDDQQAGVGQTVIKTVINALTGERTQRRRRKYVWPIRESDTTKLFVINRKLDWEETRQALNAVGSSANEPPDVFLFNEFDTLEGDPFQHGGDLG